jgi:hypothetical protein
MQYLYHLRWAKPSSQPLHPLQVRRALHQQVLRMNPKGKFWVQEQAQEAE